MELDPSKRQMSIALAHAERGWYIFPCASNKKPVETGGLNPDGEPYRLAWGTKATRDPLVIQEWWKRWPDALIGIVCKKSGLFAVDIDMKNGLDGWQSLTRLIETFGAGQDLACGPVQRTPSGGAHLIFKYPPGLKIPNNAGKLAPGLDLRSDGYICTGGAYQWMQDHGPDTTLTDAPKWLLDLIRKGAIEKPVAKREPDNPATSGSTSEAGLFWLNYYLKRAVPGTRNENGFDLACQLRDSRLTEDQAKPFLVDYAHRVPQKQGDPYTEGAALASLRSAYSAPARQPATLPGVVRAKERTYSQEPPIPDAPPIEGTTIERPEVMPTTWADMANVVGPVEWSWPGWLPKGLLTILAGESGMGKSIIALRVGACFLQGDPWPDGTPFKGEKGAMLWCEAEAAQALNLERAKAWGLPLDKIYTPLADPLADIKLDIPEHAAAVAAQAMRSEVRFIVVDSLRGAHRGDENSSETTKYINWLAELARDTKKVIILLHHLRKKSIFDGEGVQLERLRGSSAIVQTARLVWAIDAPDPQEEENRRLQVIKSNLGRFPNPVGMIIGEKGITFGAAPELPRTETVLDKATDLLISLLQAAPQPASMIESEFTQAGISTKTMQRAKEKLGVISIKSKTGWSWSLPARQDNLL